MILTGEFHRQFSRLPDNTRNIDNNVNARYERCDLSQSDNCMLKWIAIGQHSHPPFASPLFPFFLSIRRKGTVRASRSNGEFDNAQLTFFLTPTSSKLWGKEGSDIDERALEP